MQQFFAKIKTRLLTCIEAIDNYFETFKGIVVQGVKFSLAFLSYRISEAWFMLCFLAAMLIRRCKVFFSISSSNIPLRFLYFLKVGVFEG